MPAKARAATKKKTTEPRVVPKKRPPFPFVLDELAPLDPVSRAMFGAIAVYVGERIIFILRDKGPADADTGVWVAFESDQLPALRKLLPRLEGIEVFGDAVSGWKKLAASSPEFEEDVLAACALVLRGDPRIGKVPNAKKKKPVVKGAKSP